MTSYYIRKCLIKKYCRYKYILIVKFIIYSLLFSSIRVIASSVLYSKIPFSFTLKTDARTSAGVYQKDGTLIRTLWSGLSYKAGTFTQYWDGKDDDGRLAPDGSYDIKVLVNNVTYTWEGVIGNTSSSFTGIGVHRGWNPVSSMCIVGDTAFYTTYYQEQNYPINRFRLSDPQTNFPMAILNTNMNGVQFTCTDGVNVYWSQDDPNGNNNFIFATPVFSRNTLTSFSSGTAVTNKQGQVYSSTIDYNTSSNGGIYGLAVQKTGDYLFASHSGQNLLKVLNKKTGAIIQSLPVTTPRALALQTDNFLWVRSGVSITKYPINSDGTLGNSVLSITVTNPYAIAVSPDNSTLAVIDAGTQQVKGYSTNDGSLVWSLGQPNSYINNPTVTNDKFWFTGVNNPNTYSFICYASDGSFWFGDTMNSRLMHFSSNRDYIEQVHFLVRPYQLGVDPNDPTKVFQGFYEYTVDYSKPLGSNNDSWKLVRNWNNANSSYNDKYYPRDQTTFNNGHVYCLLRNTSNTTAEIWELSSSGLRNTGVVGLTLDWKLDKDGKLKRIVAGATTQTWRQRLLTGFDNKNNPIYAAETTIQSTTNIAGSNPKHGGVYTSPLAITSSDIYVSFDGSAANKSKYHLGGIQAGQTNWKWKTSYATYPEYYGKFPEDGRFDIGNGMGEDYPYGGNVVHALDRNIIWGYNGEFWKASQTNKYNHYYDNGLFVGQFGTTGPETGNEEAPAMMAGNAFSSRLLKLSNGDVFFYTGDESYHAGLHRWKITGLNSIQEQTIPITYTATRGGLTGFYFQTTDLNNLSLKTTRVDDQLDFNWGHATPAATGLTDPTRYSVRWKGFLEAVYSEPYTIYLKAAQGVRLWLDDSLYIDQWNNTTLQELSCIVNLEAGKRYALRIEAQAASTVSLSWSSARQTKSLVPGKLLYPNEDTEIITQIDLLAELPFNKVVKHGLYGWKRDPVNEQYTDRYKSWWQVATSKKTYQKESPDIWIKFRQISGNSTVSRDLGQVSQAVSWSLVGQLSYEGNEGNTSNGGSFLEVLDKEGKIIARTYVDINYNQSDRPMTVYGNTTVLGTGSRSMMQSVLSKHQPLSIVGSASGITFSYAGYASLTTSVYDASSDWHSPATVRLSFFSNNANGNYDRIIDIKSMFFTASGIRAPGSEFLIYPNPTNSMLTVSHRSIQGNGRLSIVSLDGKRLQNYELGIGSNSTSLDVRFLPSGLYVLHFEGDGYKEAARFIKY